MTTKMRTMVGSTVGGLVLLAAAAGLAGGPLDLTHSAAGTQQASSVGYHLGSQAATGGGGNGLPATGGGKVGFTPTGGGRNGFTATGGGGNGFTASGGGGNGSGTSG